MAVYDVVHLQGELRANMGEDAITPPLADVEGLAVTRMDQAVDISLKLGRDLGRE